MSIMMIWLVAVAMLGLGVRADTSSSGRQDSVIQRLILTKVQYLTPTPGLRLTMHETRPVNVTLSLDKQELDLKVNQTVHVAFETQTLAPQFRILEIEGNKTFSFSKEALENLDYRPTVSLRLDAKYIGQAQLRPSILLIEKKSGTSPVPLGQIADTSLEVVIVQQEGIWGTVFIVSVTLFIILTYVNLGAQLDSENLAQILKKPKSLVFGFLIMTSVMPLASWFVYQWLIPDQLIYRLGAFVFASGPTASASTLWTVMLDSDKELSVGLQMVSTAGSLISMPLLLYAMDVYFQSLGTRYLVKVPYATLIQLLCVLSVALLFGWRYIAPNKKAQQFSTRIFRPLTFFVLIYIIVFSSIVYWHIYAMFDWTITLAATFVTLITYWTTGFFGYLVNRNLEHAVAISISSAYKNSGVAFAVLLVTFDTPHVYIAYIPCLTQVVITSLSLYLVYMMVSLVKWVRRRGQPDPIRAQQPPDGGEPATGSQESAKLQLENEPTAEHQVTKSDELIAMNVTDLEPITPDSHRSDPGS